MNVSRFISQKSYERIVSLVRRHPITFVPYIFGWLVLLAIPVILYWLANALFPTLLENQIVWPLAVLFASIYWLSVCLFFYSYFVTFHLDLLIVTNDRLLDVEQKNLFARTIAEMDLYQVQDITSTVNGFFPSIFNYGNVLIQSAGAIPNFTIHDVPHPDKLRQEILDLSAEDRKYHEQK